VLVTHDPVLAQRCATTVHLDGGKIVEDIEQRLRRA